MELKALTEQDEKKLLDTLRHRTDAMRDRMLIALGLNTGLRREELCGLNVGDLRNRDVLHVRAETAKRSQVRSVPLNRRTQRHVKEYLNWKRTSGEPLADDAPFFSSRNHRRISIRAVNNIVSKWCREAKLSQAYTPHSLRHTFAVRILQRSPQDADRVLARVQRLLGHKGLGSTGIYLQPTAEDLRESVECL